LYASNRPSGDQDICGWRYSLLVNRDHGALWHHEMRPVMRSKLIYKPA
jgi:hypothetical protein